MKKPTSDDPLFPLALALAKSTQPQLSDTHNALRILAVLHDKVKPLAIADAAPAIRAAGAVARGTTGELIGTFPFPKLLEFFAGLCDREIGAVGLDTEAGAKAETAKALLLGALEGLAQADRLRRAQERAARAPGPNGKSDGAEPKAPAPRRNDAPQKPKSPPP